MTGHWGNCNALTRRRTVFGVISILLLILLVAVACGEEATPLAVPATATPEPTTRPISEWTPENPATLEEIEAALEKHRGESFVFVSWGGSYQNMERQAFLKPFSEKFGIEIIEESPPDYAKVRAMARTGNITWDVIDGSGQASITMGLEGVLEELDPAIVDKRSFIAHIRDAPWIGGGGSTYSFVMVYSSERYPGETGPKSWADFVDTDKIPGRRGIQSNDWYWKHIMRYSLLADNPDLLKTAEGRESLSILDPDEIEKAWAVFDEKFKPVIDVYYTGGETCASLIESGDLDMCTLDSGVVYDSIEIAKLKLTDCWECGHTMLSDNWWVPKGIKEQDPNKFELINLFMAWTGFPERQVGQAKYSAYGPTNLDAIPLLDAPEFDAVRAYLPTAPQNFPYVIALNEREDGIIGGAMADRWFAAQGK